MDKDLLMNLFKSLTKVGKDLEKLIEDLYAVADNIHSICTTAVEVKEKAEKIVSLEDVRKILAGKSQQGFRAEVKNIISKFGADKLSDIDPCKHEEILKEAEELGNE